MSQPPDEPTPLPFAHGPKHGEPVRPGPVPEIPAEGRHVQPIQVARLEYESVPSRGVGKGQQFALGGIFFYAYTAAAVFAVMTLDQRDPTVPGWLAVAFGIAAVVLIRIRTRWTAFIPGFLCALLSLPIIGLVICGIICGLKG